jgi:hypothetical protein
MANDVQPLEPSVTAMVQGIIDDAQELIRQQLALFKAEIKEDVRKAKEALISFAFGLLMVIPGCILLLIMLPQLVNWLVPELPMWVCYGIVGGVLAVLGGALVYLGVRKLESAMPEQSMAALKENVRWTTNQSLTNQS